MRQFMVLFFYLFIPISIFVGLSGCSTPKKDKLEKIRVGMDKADVLELAGNPMRKKRVHNQDRWTYEWTAEKDNDQHSMHVFFSDGRVIFVDPKGTFGQLDAPPSLPTKNSQSNPSNRKFVPVGE